MADEEKEPEKLDEVEPGGVYEVNGRQVNADGEALDGSDVEEEGPKSSTKTASKSTSKKR